MPVHAETSYGQVAEWSKAADCKSADPCGLRRFEPSPVHQKLENRNWKMETGEKSFDLAIVSHFQVSDFQFPIWGCGSNSMVESQPSKLLVAGSIPVSRSRRAVASDE